VRRRQAECREMRRLPTVTRKSRSPQEAFRGLRGLKLFHRAVARSASELRKEFRVTPSGLSAHCTLAVTDAVPVNVNVQLFTSSPSLEQAPDQIAVRPFETVSVIAVPVENDADPVLPTATLIPAGVEVTRSPLRPVAVTLSVAV